MVFFVHSAVTRGKPSLLCCFSSLPGLFEPTFCLSGTSFSPSLKCPFWVFRVVFKFFGVFFRWSI